LSSSHAKMIMSNKYLIDPGNQKYTQELDLQYPLLQGDQHLIYANVRMLNQHQQVRYRNNLHSNPSILRKSTPSFWGDYKFNYRNKHNVGDDAKSMTQTLACRIVVHL
jgi:hypothetical protein